MEGLDVSEHGVGESAGELSQRLHRRRRLWARRLGLEKRVDADDASFSKDSSSTHAGHASDGSYGTVSGDSAHSGSSCGPSCHGGQRLEPLQASPDYGVAADGAAGSLTPLPQCGAVAVRGRSSAEPAKKVGGGTPGMGLIRCGM